MSNFNLGLPIDIPWKRVCYTTDMKNIAACGVFDQPDYPPQWRSSIAISRYDPPGQIPGDPDYAPILEGMIVSYLKVAVSITPFSDDLKGPGGTDMYMGPTRSYLTNTYPCYGALLQISVKPKGEGDNDPYFSDFEPKSRELYESVSDTDEVLRGSANSLRMGKSSSSSFSVGADIANILPVPGLPKSLLGGISAGFTSSNSSSEDTTSSSERRETESHTTQLSQLYHLFQAFHVGTNRAIFLLEPRPHIKAVPATFINTPRQLEGIQEVFLVVTRKLDPEIEPPTEQQDFCIEAHLDTAHLWTTAQKPPKVELGEEPLGESWDVKVPYDMHYGIGKAQWFEYFAPDGWELVDWSLNTTPTDEHGHVRIDKDSKHATIEATYEMKGWVLANVTFHLKRTTLLAPQGFAGMFLVGRNLCCCSTPASKASSVTFQRELPPEIRELPTRPGIMTTENILNSRVVAQALREGIIESTQSDERVDVGVIPFTKSDAFFSKIIDLGKKTGIDHSTPIALSPALTPVQRDTIKAYVGDVTIDSIVRQDSVELSRVTGLGLQEVLDLKSSALRALAPLPVAPPPTSPLRRIIAVEYLTDYPNANYPQMLYKMVDPKIAPTIQQGQQLDVIDVTFDGVPDAPLTTANFFVTLAGSTLPGTVERLTMTKFRLVLDNPLIAGGTYVVVLKGTGVDAIKFNSIALAGTGTQLPTGTSLPGADFTSAINVVVPAPPPPPPPPVVPLLKVIGVRIRTTTGTPRTLFEMVRPGGLPSVNASDNPNELAFDFNLAPDIATVTTSTILVASALGPVSGTVASVSATRYTFVPTSTLAAGIYDVELKGTGTPAIERSGVKLDGEPDNLPSGDGQAGNSFTFSFQVL